VSKITLSNVGSLIDATTAATTINNNFTTIQTAFDNTLSRNGTSPNTMLSNLDMNSNLVLNTNLPTINGFSIAGNVGSALTGNYFGSAATEHYGSSSILNAISTTNPEYGMVNIVTSASGAGNVAFYKAARGDSLIMNPGTSPGWVGVELLKIAAGVGTVNGIGHEIDVNNENQNYTQAMSLAGTNLTNLVLTGASVAGFYGTSALSIRTGQSLTIPMWDVGIILGIGGYKTFNTAAIQDFSNSPTSYIVSGTHTNGIDLSGGTFSNTAFASPHFSVTGTGVINTGAAGANDGQINFFGVTSGGVSLLAQNVAGSSLLFLPAFTGTDFLVGRATTDTLTNKTITAPVIVPAASVTPINNGELVVQATSNTTLTFKLKGSDGTVRSGAITLT
jgi:hypothetical protein